MTLLITPGALAAVVERLFSAAQPWNPDLQALQTKQLGAASIPVMWSIRIFKLWIVRVCSIFSLYALFLAEPDESSEDNS